MPFLDSGIEYTYFTKQKADVVVIKGNLCVQRH